MAKAKTTKTAEKTVSVTFCVDNQSNQQFDEVFVCGNHKKLGEWNPAKALCVKKNAKGVLSIDRKFIPGEVIEYKVLNAQDWANVEKGVWGEEVQNHTVTVGDSKTVSSVVVYNWNK